MGGVERKSVPILRNLVANVAGKAWTALLGVLFIPVFVGLLGIESYGLIGIFVSISALLSVFDMGLSPTLSRELARLSVSSTAEAARESRDLARTYEVLFWGAGALIGALWIALSPVVSSHWLPPSGLPHETVTRALMLMGLVIAMVWPSAIYDGGLTGLQRLIPLNATRIVVATFQNAAGALLLWLVTRSVLLYFGWLILITLAQTLALRFWLWRSIPSGPGGSFRPELVWKHARFAAGMTGITVTSIILTQADKIVLSRALTLDHFGYYTLASSVAMTLTFIVTPVFSALFPRFAQELAAGADDVRLSTLYHRSAQTVAALVIPAAAVLVFFTDELLLLWTRNPAIVANAAPLARLLAIGSCLNAVMAIPYLLQVSTGWTRLSVLKNVVAIAVLTPWLIWGTSHYGAVAAAVAWISLNVAYVLVEVPLMHRRLLPREKWSWYRSDLAVPLATATLVAGLSRWLMPRGILPLFQAAWIVGTGVIALGCVAFAMPATREWLLARRLRPS
jgi:O-antigen/teichoic acid export membrane protein